MKLKLTLDDINRAIVSADYHVFPETTVTVCCLKLRNGFCAIGYSACLDVADFDEAMGRSEAHKVAVDKIWELEGYLARHLRSTGQPPVIAVVDATPQPVFVEQPVVVNEPPVPFAPTPTPPADIAPMGVSEEEKLAANAIDQAAQEQAKIDEYIQGLESEGVGELPVGFLTGMARIDPDVPPNDGATA